MKNLKILSATLSFTLLLALPVSADQCSYISKEQALIALSRLNVGQMIYQLCEPCGERTPTSLQIKSLSATTVDYQDFWQVQVNEEGIDLAYVFIESGLGNRPINLAAVAGCPATQVSPVLPRR